MKFKWIIIVLVLMIGEAVVMMMMFHNPAPSADQPVAEAKTADKDLMEVSVGDFKINNQSDPGMPMRVDFSLILEIDKADETAFTAIQEVKKHRINQAVMTVVRMASVDDLYEGSLATLKGELKDSISKIIGRENPYIKGIVINGYSTYEM